MISLKKISLLLASAFILAGCQDLGMAPDLVTTTQPPPPPPQGTLTFSADVLPILQHYGCTGCHGGSGGLYVGTVAQLEQGGNHGPAIVPGNGAGSNVFKKLSPNPPFGDRMPQGGPYLADSTIQLIKNWIDQGAKP